MIIKDLTSLNGGVVPPLVLEVTFQSEAEMRQWRKLLGPFPATGPTDGVYASIGDHLEKYSVKGR